MVPSWFLGADSGASGAIAGITRGGKVWVEDTPTYKIQNPLSGKNESKLHLRKMAVYLAPFKGDAFGLVEQQRLFGKDKPNVTILIESYGAWQMAFAVIGIPFVIVTPLEWKTYYFGTDRIEKEQSVEMARFHFKEYADMFLLSKDGRADAALQARYAMLKYEEWQRNGLLDLAPHMVARVEEKPKRSKSK